MHVGYRAHLIPMLPHQSRENFGRFRSIPSVSNSNQLHVVIFPFIFIILYEVSYGYPKLGGCTVYYV